MKTVTKTVTELKRGNYDAYYPISKIKENNVNRDCVKSHSNKFQTKLKNNNWMMPIVVSQNGDLFEGQHRLDGARGLGQTTVPVYIIDWIDTDVKKQHLKSIISLNNGNRAWKPLDYLKSYREENKDYKFVLNAYNENLKNISLGNIIITFFGGRATTKSYKDGEYQIENKESAKYVLRRIVGISAKFGKSKVIAYCVRDMVELSFGKSHAEQEYLFDKYAELLETESPLATSVTDLKPTMINYINKFNKSNSQLKGYRYSNQIPMFGHKEIIGYGDDDFYIEEILKSVSNKMIIKNHYAHKVAGFATTYIYLGVYLDTVLLGTLQFGYAMNAASMDKVVSDTGIKEYLELNRMWLDDKAVRNSESKAISYCIKYIRKKFPKIKWIQSFADERCGGLGIVYQAANFKYYGTHTSIFWLLNNQWYHNIAMTMKDPKKSNKSDKYLQANKELAEKIELRQFRYIYFIYQNIIKKCLLEEKQYPKHYNND